MNIDITEILSIIVYLAVAIVSAFLIPAIKSNLSGQEMAELLKWVDIGVAAAEQLYESTQGTAKKKYVLGFLESKGYTVDENNLNEMVEAAVNRLHNELRNG